MLITEHFGSVIFRASVNEWLTKLFLPDDDSIMFLRPEVQHWMDTFEVDEHFLDLIMECEDTTQTVSVCLPSATAMYLKLLM